MNLKPAWVFAFIVPIVATTNGCATAVVAGAAAAGGYIAHEKGYRLQNPVTKASGTKEKQNSGK